VVVDGVPGTADTDCDMPDDLDIIEEANDESGANTLNGWMGNVRYFNRRVLA
jgi:hypothetical protein